MKYTEREKTMMTRMHQSMQMAKKVVDKLFTDDQRNSNLGKLAVKFYDELMEGAEQPTEINERMKKAVTMAKEVLRQIVCADPRNSNLGKLAVKFYDELKQEKRD